LWNRAVISHAQIIGVIYGEENSRLFNRLRISQIAIDDLRWYFYKELLFNFEGKVCRTVNLGEHFYSEEELL